MPAAIEVIHSDPEILGGTPVFVGTRVPLRSLIDYLEGGYSLDEFLDSFPSVSRDQAVAALEGGDARTVKQQGWAGLKNGALLREAVAAGFNVFLTSDQNMEFQQNLKKA